MAEFGHVTGARKKVPSQHTGVKPVEWGDLERMDTEIERLSHNTKELYHLMTPAFGTSERIKKQIAGIESGLGNVRAEMKEQRDVIKNLQGAMQRHGLLDTAKSADAPKTSEAGLADVRANILYGLTQHIMRLPTALGTRSPLSPRPGEDLKDNDNTVGASIAEAGCKAGVKHRLSEAQGESAESICDENVAKLRKVLVKSEKQGDHVFVSDLCASVFDNKLSEKRVSELLAVVVDTQRIGLIQVYEKYVSSSNPDAEPKWIVVGKKQGKKGWVLDAALLAAMREEDKGADM